ncbi:hypothetical protein [Alicyclobacillus ferrooxydans]|uniref:hypothetical protein n=1 Tax=Alicyclobacillus ferrooxydans TaxID=471514 RepID=UPI000A7E6B47|nr:hypothetical protein [Alicyclobacillus ferrooxydans]
MIQIEGGSRTKAANEGVLSGINVPEVRFWYLIRAFSTAVSGANTHFVYSYILRVLKWLYRPIIAAVCTESQVMHDASVAANHDKYCPPQ